MTIEYIDVEVGKSVFINHGNFNEEIPCVGDIVSVKIVDHWYEYIVTKRKWDYCYNADGKQYFDAVLIYLKRP